MHGALACIAFDRIKVNVWFQKTLHDYLKYLYFNSALQSSTSLLYDLKNKTLEARRMKRPVHIYELPAAHLSQIFAKFATGNLGSGCVKIAWIALLTH